MHNFSEIATDFTGVMLRSAPPIPKVLRLWMHKIQTLWLLMNA